MTEQGKYAPALAKAVADLERRDPMRVVRSSGCQLVAEDDPSGFVVPFWDREALVTRPESEVYYVFTDEPPTPSERLLILHYLITADGVPLQNRWIAFRELPGALGYDSAFQGDTQPAIAYSYARNKAAFEEVCQAMGGERLSYGDSAFRFWIFPRLPVAVILRLADDEFPADARVLFDASAAHYLPVEDLAVLGGLVAQRLALARPKASPGTRPQNGPS